MNKVLSLHLKDNVVAINDKKVFRTVFECCKVMTNNDERSMYGSYYSGEEKGLPGFVRVSRPIFQEEHLEQEISNFFLSPNLIPTHQENPSQLTWDLDGFYRIARQLAAYKEIFAEKFTPSDAIAHIVATNYYDCMSGGMSTPAYQVCILLAQLPQIVKTTKVYPGKDDKLDIWYTLEDFIQTSKSEASTTLQQAYRLIQSQSPELLSIALEA